MSLPAFIAFTGVDRVELIDGLQALSRRYPIEWGILVDDAQGDSPLFPNAATRTRLLKAGGLRWAAHVCGAQAKAIADAPSTATLELGGFQRIQVNHGFSGSTPAQIENAWRFGQMRGARTLLQCGDPYPEDSRVDWLYDVSFGKGLRPSTWPRLAKSAFCGYSGGISPQTVGDILARIDAPADTPYWIDMESGVRSDGWLDLAKCEAVCRAVYGADTHPKVPA